MAREDEAAILVSSMASQMFRLEQQLAEQVAYGQSLRSTLSRMLKDDFSLEELDSALALSPSPQLLNKLKADSVREAITNCENKQCDDIHWSDILLEYADKLEKDDE